MDRWNWGLLLLLLLSAGCSPSAVEVTGEITLDGQPVADGMISFVPPSSEKSLKPAWSKINSGRYSISAGRVLKPEIPYRVEILAYHKTGREVPSAVPGGGLRQEIVQIIPTEFNRKSTLKATVQAGENEINFDLKTPPDPEEERKRRRS